MAEKGISNSDDMRGLSTWFLDLAKEDIAFNLEELLVLSKKSKKHILGEIRSALEALDDTSTQVSKESFIQMCLDVSRLSFLIAAKREDWDRWEKKRNYSK